MPLQVYKDYTVDYRLSQFRKVHSGDCACRGGEIDFIGFRSDEGDEILCRMIEEGKADWSKLNI